MDMFTVIFSAMYIMVSVIVLIFIFMQIKKINKLLKEEKKRRKFEEEDDN